jgi:phospholipase C
MTLAQFIAHIQTLPDQDATVLVVEHHDGRGYYDQGGTAAEVPFDPTKHIDITDMRTNRFAKGTAVENKHEILIGATGLG